MWTRTNLYYQFRSTVPTAPYSTYLQCNSCPPAPKKPPAGRKDHSSFPGGVYHLDWLVFLDLTHPTSLLPCGPDHLISLCSISFLSTYDDQYYHHDHHKATSILAASSPVALSSGASSANISSSLHTIYIHLRASHPFWLRPTPL